MMMSPGNRRCRVSKQRASVSVRKSLPVLQAGASGLANVRHSDGIVYRHCLPAVSTGWPAETPLPSGHTRLATVVRHCHATCPVHTVPFPNLVIVWSPVQKLWYPVPPSHRGGPAPVLLQVPCSNYLVPSVGALVELLETAANGFLLDPPHQLTMYRVSLWPSLLPAWVQAVLCKSRPRSAGPDLG